MKRLTLLLLIFSLIAPGTAIARPSERRAIWQPTPGTTWQIQLTGQINTNFNVQVYDIDLFETPKTTITALKAQGRRVICYFSAGSFEDWRPDADKFPDRVIGDPLDDWPGEYWLDIRRLAVLKPIMTARLDLAVRKGCDAVDPDNVDAYANTSGFPITANDQLVYNRWIAQAAHARGLAVGLKNDIEQINQLVSYFNFAVNEECFQYRECARLNPFIQAGKAVFSIEYRGDPAEICPVANNRRYSLLFKPMNLSARVIAACWNFSP
jgi:hypothetical protein